MKDSKPECENIIHFRYCYKQVESVKTVKNDFLYLGKLFLLVQSLFDRGNKEMFDLIMNIGHENPRNLWQMLQKP